MEIDETELGNILERELLIEDVNYIGNIEVEGKTTEDKVKESLNIFEMWEQQVSGYAQEVDVVKKIQRVWNL